LAHGLASPDSTLSVASKERQAKGAQGESEGAFD
jgi:hypothetical protein